MPSRDWSTSKKGKNFTEEEEQEVWGKAQVLTGYPENEVRLDACGAIIHREDYGNTSSHYGWEIDHIKPVSKGGGDEIDNLHPLQWRNNRSKGDDYPVESSKYCRVNKTNNFQKRDL